MEVTAHCKYRRRKAGILISLELAGIQHDVHIMPVTIIPQLSGEMMSYT